MWFGMYWIRSCSSGLSITFRDVFSLMGFILRFLGTPTGTLPHPLSIYIRKQWRLWWVAHLNIQTQHPPDSHMSNDYSRVCYLVMYCFLLWGTGSWRYMLFSFSLSISINTTILCNHIYNITIYLKYNFTRASVKIIGYIYMLERPLWYWISSVATGVSALTHS